MAIPESPVGVPGFCDIRLAQGNEFLGRLVFENDTAFLGFEEILVVRDIAEKTCRDDEAWVIPEGMPLGEKMLFRKGEPRGERFPAVQAAIDAFPFVPLVRLKGIPAQ